MRQRPDEQEERKTDSSSLGVKEKEQDRLQVRHIFETDAGFGSFGKDICK